MKAKLNPKKKAPLAPVITKSTVTSRAIQRASQANADKSAELRNQAALREIERWDVARKTRPHVPAIASDLLRNDDLKDISPIIQTIIDRAGECPDTPPLDLPEHSLFAPPRAETRDLLAIGASLLGVIGCILVAVYLASGSK